METDFYKTIDTPSEGLYKDRGSKFIAFAHPAGDEEEAKLVLEDIKKKYHDARHHCYAYKFGMDENNFRSNDDGEPSGTAGKPIYGQILSYGLTNVIIVVIRYFGGTKLGVRGLIDAYKGATKEALEKADIKERYVKDYFMLTFEYPLMNEVMRLLRDDRIEQIENKYEMNCRIRVAFRQKFSAEISSTLKKLHGLEVEFLKTM